MTSNARLRDLIEQIHSNIPRTPRETHEFIGVLKKEFDVLVTQGSPPLLFCGWGEKFVSACLDFIQSPKDRNILAMKYADAVCRALLGRDSNPLFMCWASSAHTMLSKKNLQRACALITSARGTLNRGFNPVRRSVSTKIPIGIFRYLTNVSSLEDMWDKLEIVCTRHVQIKILMRGSLMSLFPAMRVHADGRSHRTDVTKNVFGLEPFSRSYWQNFYPLPGSLDSLVAKIVAGPAFRCDTLLIQRAVLAHQNEDWISAISILASLPERGARSLLQSRGVNPFKNMSDEGDLSLRLWGSLFESLKTSNCLSDSHLIYLQDALDPDGANLRNGVCHGLFDPSEYTASNADTLLQCVWILGQCT